MDKNFFFLGLFFHSLDRAMVPFTSVAENDCIKCINHSTKQKIIVDLLKFIDSK